MPIDVLSVSVGSKFRAVGVASSCREAVDPALAAIVSSGWGDSIDEASAGVVS